MLNITYELVLMWETAGVVFWLTFKTLVYIIIWQLKRQVYTSNSEANLNSHTTLMSVCVYSYSPGGAYTYYLVTGAVPHGYKHSLLLAQN